MKYFLLFLVVLFVSAQSIIQKQYNVKTKDPNVFTFCGFFAIAALLFFLLSSGFKFSCEWGVFPYAFGFAVTYGLSVICGVQAINCGPMGITLLIGSYSLLVPTFYGIIFLKDPIGETTYIGIALLTVTLFLLNFKNEKINFSLKWLICVVLSFVGNGMGSTIQKMQQMKFAGNYKNELMIIALIIVAIIMFVAALINKEKITFRSLPYSFPKGIANGIVNLLVMVLTGLIHNAILFPVISAGGIVIGFFVSVFVYKEKLSKLQYFGYSLGVISVIMLNIK